MRRSVCPSDCLPVDLSSRPTQCQFPFQIKTPGRQAPQTIDDGRRTDPKSAVTDARRAAAKSPWTLSPRSRSSRIENAHIPQKSPLPLILILPCFIRVRCCCCEVCCTAECQKPLNSDDGGSSRIFIPWRIELRIRRHRDGRPDERTVSIVWQSIQRRR